MDSNFSIPGLGQLPTKEEVTTSNEAPTNLSATASTDASRDAEMADASPGRGDVARQSTNESDAMAAASQMQDTTTADNLNSQDRQTGQEDVKMEDQSSIEHQDTVEDAGAAQGVQDMQGGKIDALAEANAEADSPPQSPRVTGALEAALDDLLGPTPQDSTAQNGEGTQVEPGRETVPAPDEQAEGDEHPEWEADSSPYESSSSDSSDDSSDDDDDSDVDESKLLGIEETARLLMEADGGSDDEMDGARAAKQAASVRTKNELPDEPEPKPEITISPEDTIAPLGIVQHIVEGTYVVIEALRDGSALSVLDRGTVLCKEDRSVLGVVHDTIATVHRPMYILRFRSDEEAKEAALEKGSQIWYPKSQAIFVFPSQLRMEKGSDASNLHDEEVGPDEVEYSDDEQEQAHKREKKNRKRGAKGKSNRGDDNNSRGAPTAGESNLNYGEEEDGTYNKLPRPPNFGMGLPAPPPPGMSAFPPTNGSRGNQHGGRRGDGRGRGGRGRGYSGRGRGGGQGYSNSNNSNSNIHGHSSHPLPPQPAQPQNTHQPPPPFAAGPAPPGQWPYPLPPMPQFGGAPPPAHSSPQAPSYPMPAWGAASTQSNPFPFPVMPPATWSNPQQEQRPPPLPQQPSWTPPAGGYGMPQQYAPSSGSSAPAPAPNYQYPNYYGGQAQGSQQPRWS